MISSRVHLVQVICLGSLFGLALPQQVAADECSFRGEIVLAEDYNRIVLEPAGPARAVTALGPHAPLFPGDTLLVQGNQVVWIRDKPGGKLREITAGDGRVTIGQPETCTVRRGLEVTRGRLISRLMTILKGPVADQVVVMTPRLPGQASPEGATLAFKDGQLLAEGISTLGLFWTGLDATVSLRSTMDGRVLLSTRSEGIPLVESRFSEPLHAGDRLELLIGTAAGQVTRSVSVVSPDKLPQPAGVESIDNLSATEAAIYAIWLVTEGPLEWRLQGMTLLFQAADFDYMAWKVLRALSAE